MALEITKENFEAEVAKAAAPVLVDFWASWCGPCQTMIKVVDELTEDNAGKNIKIGKCNVDTESDLAEKYDIMSIPAFLIFKEGEVVERITGALPKQKLQELIDKHI